MSPRAVFPEPGYRRRSVLGADGLAVTVVDGSGRSHGPFDFSDLPAHGTTRDELIDAFVECSSPRGPWQSPSSLRTAHGNIRHFLRQLEPLGIRIETIADFTAEHWWTWRGSTEARHRWPGAINNMRTLLRHCPSLPALTVRAMAHRVSKPKRRLYGSYTPAEFAKIRSLALADVRATEARVRRNTLLLQEYWDGKQCSVEGTVFIDGRHCSAGEVLNRLYPSGRLHVRSGYRRPASSISALLGHPDVATANALFPNKLEIFSAMVLLVCDRGYNASTLTSLALPESAGEDSEGGRVLITHLDKPRRRALRHFTHSHAGPGARSLELITSMTDTARGALRELGHPTEQLLIAAAPNSATSHPTKVFVTDGFTNGGTAHDWSTRHQLLREDGSPLAVSMARLRLTEQVVNRKASQNTDAVSEDIYRTPDALTAAMIGDVVLDGQQDAVDHAKHTMAMRFVSHPAELGLPEKTRQALSTGRLDTATGACVDQLHSPFSPPGTPCTASFLMCLACPNAVATPSHLPRLATLAKALDNLATVSPERFSRDYSAHRGRLADVLHQASGFQELDRAAATATDQDRDMVERLLRRELDA